jgi:hypothetical protein
MLHSLFRAAFISLIALTSAILMMKIVGTFRPVHPVMAGLDDVCGDKPQPCWYGVALGRTTVDEVKAIFGASGDSFYDNITKGAIEIFKTSRGGCFAQFVYGRSGSTIINEIILTNCARVRLGDLLAHRITVNPKR